MQSINEDIKSGELKPVYLLYGPEAYLRRQYRDKLKEALVPENADMNFHYFEGKDVSFAHVIDLAETLPFFAKNRLLILENTQAFAGAGEQLTEYMKELPASTCFVFVEASVDKRSKMFKRIRENGRAVEFASQDENVLKRWIDGLVKKEGKQIEGAAIMTLLEKTGSEMDHIKRELEKVICYALERDVIRRTDVEAVCTERVSNRIFDMINAVAQKQQKQALKLYYDLLELKEPPMRILYLIARQFNLLMQVKELKGKGYDHATIAQKTSLQPFLISKYQSQAASFASDYLRKALEDCVKTEEAVKTGSMNDRMSVELLIIEYSK